MDEKMVVAVQVRQPYLLDLTFAGGERRTVDMEQLLLGEVFQPLRDWDYFVQVRVYPEIGTIAWPNGADLAPEFLYYDEETSYRRVEIARSEGVGSAAPTAR